MISNRILFLAAIVASFLCGAGFVFFTENDDAENDPVRQARDLILEHAISPNLSDAALSKGAEDGAVNGMIGSLDDRFSSYVPMDDESGEHEDASFAGIGVVVREKDGAVVVQEVYPATPASLTAIGRGDTIVAIDGESVTGIGIEETVRRLRGDEGTDVTITLEDPDGDALEVTVTRQRIEAPVVTLDVKERDGKRFAHVTVRTFDEKTMPQFVISVTAAALMSADDGIILDLRGNTGGALEAAHGMACSWIADGEIALYMEGRDAATTRTVRCQGTPPLAAVPTIVLVDEHTASASEIVAAALQDHGKARILGTKTFGKGVGQSPFELHNGGVLLVTSFKWFSPDHRSVTGTGVMPDELLPARTPEQVMGDEPDLQLEHALRHLADAQ